VINNNTTNLKLKNWTVCFTLMALMLVVADAAAGTATLGAMASNITNSFKSLAKLITTGSYIAGLGFALGAIMKFKAHKDNPTQIPIGTPVALLFIAAALLFLPTVLDIAGTTMFGAGAKSGGAGLGGGS